MHSGQGKSTIIETSEIRDRVRECLEEAGLPYWLDGKLIDAFHKSGLAISIVGPNRPVQVP